MLARLKITTRINVILFLAVLGTLIVTSIGYSMLRAQMMDERQSQLRNLLDLAVQSPEPNMMAAGGPSTEAGRKAFFSVLQSSHFGDAREANYIFAYDYNGVVTCHERPLKNSARTASNSPTRTAKSYPGSSSMPQRGPQGRVIFSILYEKGVGGLDNP